MSETPLATMSQVGDEGDARAASTKGTSDTSSNTTPAVQSNTAISEADYEAIADAVMETERGRWFLKEYARRNRNTDTQTVLDALERLEDRITTDAPSGGDTSVALISHNVIDLAEAITQVKREVQELGGQGDDKDHFNSATEELEAIVTQTETATGEILEAAEKIQEVLWTLREEGASETQCDIIESKIIDVYTACSFQDLTGQRSSKVVRLVSYVEKRVSAMMGILGLSSKESDAESPLETARTSEQGNEPSTSEAYQEGDERSDAHLLHGPALDGDAIEQDDVDALFGGGGVAETDDALAADASEGEPFDAILEEDPLVEDTPQEVKPEAAAPDLAEMQDEAEAQAEPEPLSEPELPTEPELADAEAIAEDANDEGAGASDEVDIITGDMVVELHDAEILRQPAEDALINDALSKSSAPPDIFDVEALDFDGPDMGQRGPWDETSETASEVQSPRDDRKVLVDMPDDFVVDAGAADMFVDTASSESDEPARVETEASAAAQDIFDVDEFGFDDLDVGTEAEAFDEVAEPETVSEADTVSVDPIETELDEAVLDHALNELETAVSEEQAAEQDAKSDPVTADNANTAEDEPEPVPYTDEERIALFS
ncbi:MAG: protein phosphatase CheZ [Hyphomicrobiales bacterium]